MLRGLAAGFLGLHLSWIGFSAAVGTGRFVGDSVYLYDGIPRIPFIIIGLLAIPELLKYIFAGGHIARQGDPEKVGLKATLSGFFEVFKYPLTLLWSSFIGVIVGITPGIGSGTAVAMSWSLAKRFSKYRDKLGTGHPVGIIVAEAPADAVEGAALIPTLLFGIPGSGAMVVLLGAFMLHGIQPGPAMFLEHKDIIWSLILSLLISNLWASFVLVFVRGFFVRLVSFPMDYIASFVLVVGLVGTFAMRQNIWDVLCGCLLVCLGIC